jgi:hypothetical protein
VATLDPRLTSEALLRLAAWRLTHGPPRLPALPEEDGLCALLQHAALLRQHGLLPPRDAEDVEAGVYEGAPGFGGLLWEARKLCESHSLQQQEGEA